MGVTGLIPFCEQACEQTSLVKFRGMSVAVDSYCLLHKGSYSVADKLVKNIAKTTAHIDYCIKYVDLLLRHGLRPIMVFDGKNLPAKAMTEANRRKGRDEAKKKAQEFMKQGKMQEARKEFVKAVDITHEHAVQLMQECRKIGVDCITAPYEADSQLAYLNKIKLAELVISEDSDLILFGCKKILFKLQLDGRCLYLDSSKLHLTIGVPEDKFCFDKFRRICILSGCDYLNSLHGIGLGKAKKFMMMTEETDMEKALLKMPSYLNMKKLEVTPKYIEGFLKAEATFKHMFVFDPVKREMLRLNPIENDEDLQHCINAGELLPPQISYQLALGNINPRSNQPVDEFNPDTKKPLKHRSIWATTIFTAKKFSQPPLVKHKQPVEVQNIIDQENDVTAEIEIDDLLSSYTEIVSTKRRNSDSEENEADSPIIETPPSKNPFAKRHQPDVKKSEDSKPSMTKNFSMLCNVKTEARVVSRFFASSAAAKVAEDREDTRKLAELMKTVNEERQKQHEQFYDAVKVQSEEIRKESSDEGCSSMDTQEEVVDLDSYEYKPKSQKQTFLNDVKPKTAVKTKPVTNPKGKSYISKPKLQDNSSVQTRLSAFGFKKQSTMTLSQFD